MELMAKKSEVYPIYLNDYPMTDPWDWFIYLLIYHKSDPQIVGQYIAYMDPVGYMTSETQLFQGVDSSLLNVNELCLPLWYVEPNN